MNFFKIIILLSLFLSFFLFHQSFAQIAKPDTSTVLPYEEEDFDDTDTITTDVKQFIPADMIFVPSDLLYDHQWNNVNIRYRKIDIAGKKDTTLILFNTSPENNFYFPIRGRIVSPFGYRHRHFHTGLDIHLNHNDSVYCVMAGKVRLARKERGYGNVVVVRHYNGLETLYAHLNKICVSVNDELNGGDLIGLGGRTGHATGDHLHFETRFLEQPINPLAFIDFEHFKLKSDTLILTANTFTALTTPPNKPTGKTKSKGHKSTTHKAGGTKTISADTSGDNTNPASNKTNTKSSSPSKGGKYYIVKSGDVLSSIAQKNHTTVAKLCKLNGISKKKLLHIGQKLKVS